MHNLSILYRYAMIGTIVFLYRSGAPLIARTISQNTCKHSIGKQNQCTWCHGNCSSSKDCRQKRIPRPRYRKHREARRWGWKRERSWELQLGTKWFRLIWVWWRCDSGGRDNGFERKYEEGYSILKDGLSDECASNTFKTPQPWPSANFLLSQSFVANIW